MLSSQFVRSSGLAGITAGVLGAVGFVIHPPTEDVMGILDPAWVPAHFLLWIAFTLALFAFIGIHASQSEKAGILGRVGFVVLFIATVALTGIFFVASTLEPFLAVQAPSAIEAMEMSSILLILLASILTFSAGGILFGTAIVRARVLSRTGGILIVIGCVLLVATVLANMPEKISDATGVIFSAGLVLLGRSLWTTKT